MAAASNGGVREIAGRLGLMCGSFRANNMVKSEFELA